MPVFNRLALTQQALRCLRSQTIVKDLTITVVDDGSTDGTAAYLSSQRDVTVLEGDGTLWWGGAIELALQRVLRLSAPEDWVLFANNDTTFDAQFIEQLVSTARTHAPAAVGSVIRDIEPPHSLLSIGPKIDANRLLITDAILQHGPKLPEEPVCELDALSGRGTLYPVAAFASAGTLRPRWAPHYLADYEMSLRVRRAGFKLLVDGRAAVYSRREYGNAFRPGSLFERFFSLRSPFYLRANALFWWEASGWCQRLTLPVRIPFFIAFPRLRKTGV